MSAAVPEHVAVAVAGLGATARPLDAEAARYDFPILKRVLPNGKPLIYLDNAATTQKPQVVIDTLTDYYTHHNSNVHRAIHTLAAEATDAYEGARAKVSAWFGAPAWDHVIWTAGTTESLNTVAHAWARHNLADGDVVVLTEMEHHSNIIPWQLLQQERGIVLRFIPVGDDFQLDLSGLDGQLVDAKLVSMVHTSNTLGTRNPVELIIEKAHAVGARVCLDCAQAAPHDRLDVAALGADFVTVSGHKMVGPTGIGALILGEGVSDEMQPFMGGGDMIDQVWLDHATYTGVPHRFEAGTPKIAPAIGLGAAVDWLSQWDMHSVHEHTLALARQCRDGLLAIGGTRIFGDHDRQDNSGVVSFLHDDIHATDLATLLDAQGIAIRTGHHCTQPLMRKLGVPATARASMYLYNTEADVDAFLQAMARTVRMLA